MTVCTQTLGLKREAKSMILPSWAAHSTSAYHAPVWQHKLADASCCRSKNRSIGPHEATSGKHSYGTAATAFALLFMVVVLPRYPL